MADPKEKDTQSIVKYLTTAFNIATTKLPRPIFDKETGANELYLLQTEFAYRLHEITLGPTCMVQKHIAACNAMIDQVHEKHNKF